MKRGLIWICLLLLLFCLLIPRQSVEGFSDGGPTFHILIATGGRPSLKNLLDSLKDELSEGDAITIVFDGPEAKAKSTYEKSWMEGHRAKINSIEQNPNLGFWGHGIRNKYQGILEPKTTFLMNADDDDIYLEGAFNKLRRLCTKQDTLYIGKMDYENIPGKQVPSQAKELVLGDIGTPNGIIPMSVAAKGEWGHKYGGDFMYYDSLIKTGVPYEFLDLTMYRVF
jgi:hypothetical protein